jgi:hypothetical protein
MKPTLVVLEDHTERDTRIVARVHLGLSYPEEYRIRGPHHALLEDVRRITGGRLLGEKGSVLALRLAAPREYPLWPGLAWLGLGLFLADLVLARSGSDERKSGAPLGERTRSGPAWAFRGWKMVTRAGEGSRERACTRS